MNEPHLEKLELLPRLLDAYGSLLTDKQRQALALFYEEDYTLAEIAGLHGSSRQAVHNLIERGEALLHEYEASLGLLRREQQQEQIVAELRALISELKPNQAQRAQAEELLCRL